MKTYYYCHNPQCKKVTPLSEPTEYCPKCQIENGEVIDQAECNRLVGTGVFVYALRAKIEELESHAELGKYDATGPDL